MSARRIFFYVQHLLGIGHIARASRICSALADDGFDVTVVTGGLPVPGFPGPNMRTIALPPVVASNAGFSGLADEHNHPVSTEFLEARRDFLLNAFHQTRPDVVIVEAFPFGRRQMRFELLPLLEAIKAANLAPMLFSSVRDILQESRKPGRNEETVALIQRHFDGILVHGDPAFVRLEDTFPLTHEIADKVFYTGLVAAPPVPPSHEIFDVIASAGGGAVGLDLVRASCQAAAQLSPHLRWLVITGPNLPQADFDDLATRTPAHVTLTRFRPDFPALLRNARVSVSQGGYNTVCDVLQAGCRAVLVPFASGGETEQTVRAEFLARLGLAEILPEQGLAGEHVAKAVHRALEKSDKPAHPLDMNGAQRTATLIRHLLG